MACGKCLANKIIQSKKVAQEKTDDGKKIYELNGTKYLIIDVPK